MKLFLVIKRVWKILWGNKPHTNEVFYIGGTEVLPPPLETDAVSYTHLDVYKRQDISR